MFQIVFYLLALSYAVNGCNVILQTGLPEYSPVILVSQDEGPYELFKPTGQVNTFAEGSVLHLSCLGTDNSITSTGQNELYLTCGAEDQWLDSDNNAHNLIDLGCQSIPSSSIQYSGESCSNGQGQILQPGFQIDDEFYPTFDICYDNVTEQNFYSHQLLNGAAIGYQVQERQSRAFSAEGLTLTTEAVNEDYTIDNQIAQFEALFGEDQGYVSSSTYWTPLKLATNLDFILSYEELATYYYANTAPVFHVANGGNWWRVEYQARRLASQVNRDLSIYDGYFGQLSLPDSNGDLIEVNLDEAGNIPIPQYIFKVVHDEQSDSAIVFLSYNSPFETSVTELCPNVCAQAGIDNSSYKRLNRGYTYCCTLDDFLNIYNDLPEELSASNLLTSSTQ